MGALVEKLEIDINVFDVAIHNIANLCHSFRMTFPEYVATKGVRLWLPRYLIEFMLLDNNKKHNYIDMPFTVSPLADFKEGEDKFMGIPIYINHSDEAVIGITEFHFYKENPPRMKMSKIMTEKPITE